MFSDLHVFAHLSRSQFEDIAIDFLYYLLKYSKSNKIERIFFLGDWFHIKNKLYVPPFIRSIEVLRLFKEAGIDITFLIGNHDAPQMNTTDNSIMYAFQEFGKVIPLYEWEDIDDIRFHLLSYTNELPKFELTNNKANILLGHLDIKNFVMESGMSCQEGFNIQSFKNFDMVYSGHFHKHQINNNVVYIGSPYQTRYSERFDQKGFIELDTKTADWKFIEYNSAPTFKEIDIEEYDEENVKGNFIRIKTHKGNDNLPDIKNKFLELGAESVDFIFEDEEETNELNMIEDLTTGSIQELSSAFYDNILENDLFPKGIKTLLDADKIDKNDFMFIFKDIEESHLAGWKPEDD